MPDLVPRLTTAAATKIVLVRVDGLGGVRTDALGSERHAAATPNLDRLAREGSSGLHTVVAPGVTAGSGAGHLAVFGYDPLVYELGRGELSAAGVGFPLKPGDVAARVNFCTLDANGVIADRRAGRISTEVNIGLTERLRDIRLPGVEVLVEPVKEHRFVLVLRGAGLGGRLSETDPQTLGTPPLPVRALEPSSERTADLVNRFVAEARQRLTDAAPANMVLLRGFDQLPALPRFPEIFGLRAAAIAAYPMYRGLAKLVGMEVLKTGSGFADEVATLRQHWEGYDYFFVHYKDTDKAGEDGDFDAKVSALERFDAFVPEIRALGPDVIVVSGDHASPSVLASHGWQPVPVLLWSRYCGADPVKAFSERACAAGTLGVMPAQHLMPLVMANALRLTKYGA